MGAVTGAGRSGRGGHQNCCENGMIGGLRLKKQGGEYEGLRHAADLGMVKRLRTACILVSKRVLIREILLPQLGP